MKSFVLILALLLCSGSKADTDTFPITIVGNRTYNAYEAKSTWVVRISNEEVERTIATQPKNPLALFVAATRGDVELTKKLLGLGADPNQKTLFGQYPIHEAACFGHARVLDLLLAAGADVNVRISAKGNDGPNQWMALHFAAYGGYLNIAKALIAKGATLNPKDSWGMTPLHYAIQQKHPELVTLLMEKGATQ